MKILTRTLLGNQRGLTLAELIIASGIASVVFLGAGTLIVQANRAIKSSQQRQHMMDNLLTANMALYRYMGQAIGMRWQGNNNINTQSVSTGGGSCFNGAVACGRIRQFAPAASQVSAFNAAYNPPVSTLAIFLKESQPSTVDGSTATTLKLTKFTGVGIFYQMQSTQYSGVLWITEVTNAGGNILRPGDASAGKGSISFENVVDVQVLNPDPPNVGVVPPNNLLRGVDLMVRMRAFTNGERSTWRFCTPAEMAALPACATTSPYVEVDRTIHITFRNNVLTAPRHATLANERFFERVYGPLYFFDFNFPRIVKTNSSEGM